jgi:hypothetical protein
MRFVTRGSLFLFVLLSCLKVDAEVCSTDKLIGSCDALKKSPLNVNGASQLNLPKFEDGSTIYNDLGRSKMKKEDLLPPTPGQRQQALVLSEKIRKASQDLVVGDTRADLLSSEQKAMVSRLKSVRISIADSKDERCNTSPDSAIDPNASYNQWTHTISICPPTVKLSAPAFLMLVAHEFGHVISPCTMNRDLYKVDAKKVDSTPVVEKCLDGKSNVRFAQTMFPDRAEYSVLPRTDSLSPRYKDVVSKLQSCGTLTTAESIERNEQPSVFSRLSKCLTKTYAPNHSNYLKSISKSTPPESSLSRASSPPADANSLNCMGIVEEHFAEAVGAKAFANMLGSGSRSTETAKVGLVQMMGYACGEKSAPKKDPGMMFRYPTSVDRVQLQMADSKMQAALGCEVPPSAICQIPDSGANAGTGSKTGNQEGTVK